MTETPALLIYATYRLVPDDVEAFRSLASRMATTAKSRDGCAFLDVAQDLSDPATRRAGDLPSHRGLAGSSGIGCTWRQ